MGKPILESDLLQEIKEMKKQIEELGVALNAKAPFVEQKVCSESLACTEAYKLIPNLTYTTPVEGKWLIECQADMESVGASMGFVEAFSGGGALGGELRSTTGRESVSLSWMTGLIPAGTVLECRGKRFGGTSITIFSAHTKMTVTLITN